MNPMEQHRRKEKQKSKLKNKAERVKNRERLLLAKNPDDLVTEIEKLHRMDLAGLLDGHGRRQMEKAIETHKAAIAKRQQKGLGLGDHAAYAYPKVLPTPEERAAKRKELKAAAEAEEEEEVQKRLAALTGGGGGGDDDADGSEVQGPLDRSLLFAMPASMRVRRQQPRQRVAPKPAAVLLASSVPARVNLAPSVSVTSNASAAAASPSESAPVSAPAPAPAPAAPAVDEFDDFMNEINDL